MLPSIPIRGQTDDSAAGDMFTMLAKDRFVMCPPKYLSTAIPNNVFMKNEPVNVDRAMKQYDRIIRAFRALDVTVLEIPPVDGCQDQTYVANIGVAINPFIVLAKFKAEGRPCEEDPARAFFQSEGYQVIQPPTFFEGEADFKKWKAGVYFGGWGKFTDRATLDWIEDACQVKVIPIHETSDELYHLDCSLFIMDEQNFLVNREGMDSESFKALESIANLTLVPPDIMSCGVTNCVKIPGDKPILFSGMFFTEMEKYRKAMEWMNANVGDKFGKTVFFLDIDEPDKSGADISCMVMHLDF